MSAPGRLDGHIALVTGAGRGIGRAIVLAFAREGAAVAVCARTQAQIDAVAEVGDAGGTVRAYHLDVTDDDASRTWPRRSSATSARSRRW